MFWDLQGSILGCVASMLDLFCVLVFNLGPILGFRGTIGAPSTPFYLLEKSCLFLDGTFSISTHVFWMSQLDVNIVRLFGLHVRGSAASQYLCEDKNLHRISRSGTRTS